LLRPLHIHAVDQPGADPVDVHHLTFSEELAVGRAHHLPDSEGQRTTGALTYRERFDVGIDLGPLRGPVVPYGLPAGQATAFPSVRPVHLLAHHREDGIDIAAVERLVERLKMLEIIHCFSLLFGPPGPGYAMSMRLTASR
jgi:hypothetical protein